MGLFLMRKSRITSEVKTRLTSKVEIQIRIALRAAYKVTGLPAWVCAFSANQGLSVNLDIEVARNSSLILIQRTRQCTIHIPL